MSHDIREAKAPFRAAVVVCRKCARKLHGEGFGEGGAKSFRKAAKRALKSGRWGRKVRVVEVDCLGLCPKRRQVVAGGRELAAGRLLALDPGADVEAALDRLLGPAAGAEDLSLG